ncbi:MAG: hypothetical protein K8R46_02975 [Pirellulales bacterium]|nr:hypothetical protein [Pirellulales bacterium]
MSFVFVFSRGPTPGPCGVLPERASAWYSVGRTAIGRLTPTRGVSGPASRGALDCAGFGQLDIRGVSTVGDGSFFSSPSNGIISGADACSGVAETNVIGRGAGARATLASSGAAEAPVCHCESGSTADAESEPASFRPEKKGKTDAAIRNNAKPASKLKESD